MRERTHLGVELVGKGVQQLQRELVRVHPVLQAARVQVHRVHEQVVHKGVAPQCAPCSS